MSSEQAGQGLLEPAFGVYDPDGSPLTAQLVPDGGAEHGLVTVATDGSWTYVPGRDWFGADRFSYVVSDDGGGSWSSPVRVDLAVSAVDDPPVAVADGPYHTAEDRVLLLAADTLLANDLDIEEVTPARIVLDDTITPTLGHTEWDANAGQVVYTPDANASGEDEFAYRALDSEGLPSGVVRVAVVVDPVNDPPVAMDDAPQAFRGPLTLRVLDNDTDVEDALLTSELRAQPIGGVIVPDGAGAFTYTPDAGFFGPDEFTYVALDTEGASSQLATVRLFVDPDDDEPTDTGSAPCEPLTWFADADGDGFGDAARALNACDAPPKHVADETDCDDTRAEVFPGADEIVADGVDQDCTGSDFDLKPEGACNTAPEAPWWAGAAALLAAARRRRPTR